MTTNRLETKREARGYIPIALHGRNGYTLLYGLPPSRGYAVEDPKGEIVRGKDGLERRFKTPRGARISAALLNRRAKIAALILFFLAPLLLAGCSLRHIPAYSPPNQLHWNGREWSCPAGYELVDKWTKQPPSLYDKTDRTEQDSWDKLNCKEKP